MFRPKCQCSGLQVDADLSFEINIYAIKAPKQRYIGNAEFRRNINLHNSGIISPWRLRSCQFAAMRGTKLAPSQEKYKQKETSRYIAHKMIDLERNNWINYM